MWCILCVSVVDKYIYTGGFTRNHSHPFSSCGSHEDPLLRHVVPQLLLPLLLPLPLHLLHLIHPPILFLLLAMLSLAKQFTLLLVLVASRTLVVGAGHLPALLGGAVLPLLGVVRPFLPSAAPPVFTAPSLLSLAGVLPPCSSPTLSLATATALSSSSNTVTLCQSWGG